MAQLYFYYSAMNAGKSTSLLQSAHNYREQGMRVAVFTAAIDDRFGGGRVSSRIGLAAEAELFDASTDFLAVLESRLPASPVAGTTSDGGPSGAVPPMDEDHRSGGGDAARGRFACVLVDEAQFLTGVQVDQLARVVDEHGVPVLCFGLRTDFRGELFPGSARLLAIGDKLAELKTVCDCGRKATMTVRLDAEGRAVAAGEQVEIGGNERYESKCRRRYRELVDAARASGSGASDDAS